jgi:SAM-dependent methyltransferase
MSKYDHLHFERLYEEEIDPWRFRDSDYEADKYQKTIDALPPGTFSLCLELGCSIGVLTRLLAEKCDRIIAIDTSEKAIREAEKACAGLRVDFRQAHLPKGRLGQGMDLVVASEVLYYLEPDALSELAKRLSEAVKPSAVCIGVHWTGSTDYPLGADEACELFATQANLTSLDRLDMANYRLDVWQFPDSCALSDRYPR